MRQPKPWTTGEIEQLRQWRALDVPLKTCAKRLGRTRAAVSGQCHRAEIVMEPHHKAGEAAEQIRALATGSAPADAVLAFRLGISKRTVRYHRTGAGLKAGKPQSWSQGGGRRKRGRPRCFSCNALAPVCAVAGWRARLGWALFRLGPERHYLCDLPECRSGATVATRKPIKGGPAKRAARFRAVVADAVVFLLCRYGWGDPEIATATGLHLNTVYEVRRRLSLRNNFPARYLNRASRPAELDTEV